MGSHVKNLRMTQNIRHILAKHSVRAKVYKNKTKHDKSSKFILFGRNQDHFDQQVKSAAAEIESFMESKLLKKKADFLKKFGNMEIANTEKENLNTPTSKILKNSNMRKPNKQMNIE